MAQRGQVAAGEPGQHLRQVVEGRLAGDQRVEGGVGEQVEGEREPVGEGPARAAGRGDRAHLAAAHHQPAGVEGLPQRQADPPVAVPAQLDDGALRGEQLQRPREPLLGGAGVHDEVAVAEGVLGRREADAQRLGDGGPRRVRVDQLHPYRRETGRAGPRHRSRPSRRPTTAIRSPTSGAASHRAFTAVSTVPASTARAAGTVSGTGVTASAGTT